MSNRKEVPIILLVEWLRGNKVRLWFTTGRVSIVELPIKSAKKAHIVFGGVGLDIGNGREYSATTLHDWPDSEVIQEGATRGRYKRTPRE